MFVLPSWSLVSNPYYSHDLGRDSLLITAGDSWTYGDSLGKTKVRMGLDDTEHRINHVYGRLVSEDLHRDWINLALPGISNRLLLSWLDKTLSGIKRYDDIICVVNLTESGRHEDLIGCNPETTMHETLLKMLSFTYNKIEKLKSKNKGVRFLVTHNFTDGLYHDLPDTWLEVMLSKKIGNSTHIVLSEHITHVNSLSYFPDKDEIIDKALARLDLLDSCRFCHQGDSRHPNEQGHEAWASYLLNLLK